MTLRVAISTTHAGISDEEIEMIKEGYGTAKWTPLDQAVMSAVEEFRTETFVSDAT